MNAFKKYIRSKGVKLECDYPCLPYYVKGKSCFEPGYIIIEAVTVNAEKAVFTQHYNVLSDTTKVNRDGTFSTYDDSHDGVWIS